MKKIQFIIISLVFMSLATMLTGCITEECAREGLAVYTQGWDGPNYSSVCIGGVWIDTPIEVDMKVEALFTEHPNCKTIGCYNDDLFDCECLESYPYEMGRNYDNK